MKKHGIIILLIAAVLLTLLFNGCGGSAGPGQTAQNSTPAVTVTAVTPAVQTEAPEPEQTAEPTPTVVPEETTVPEQTEAPAPTAAPEQTGQPAETTAPEQTGQPVETTAPEETPALTETPQATQEPEADPNAITVEEDGEYSDKDHVALYLHTYGHLPSNYVTKNEAKAAGWDSGAGNLIKVLPGKSIGGDYFGNYEGRLPKAKGRKYYECDINFNPKGKTSGRVTRGGERIVYSNDGLIFYSPDHFDTFEQLY